MIFPFIHSDPSYPRNWPDSCAFRDRNLQLPKRSGVYAVLNARGQILYIGQAVNLRRRWLGRSHGRYPQARRVFRCRLHWQLVGRFELNDVEQSLIRRFAPAWNNTPLPKRGREWQIGSVAIALMLAVAVIVGNLLRQLSPFWIISLLASVGVAVAVVLYLEKLKGSRSGGSSEEGENITDTLLTESFLSVAAQYGTSVALKATATAVRSLSSDYDNQVPLLDCAEQLEAITDQLSD